MESVESKIAKASDLQSIFEHLIDIYFVEDHFLFYGEKFVNYNQLHDDQYLNMVHQTQIYVDLRDKEERLLVNCINIMIAMLSNFGFCQSVYKFSLM